MNKHLHEYLNMPVNLCHQTKQPRDLSGKDTRYYVYKFTSNGQYFSGDASGAKPVYCSCLCGNGWLFTMLFECFLLKRQVV